MTITAKDLIVALKRVDPEAEVFVCIDGGDGTRDDFNSIQRLDITVDTESGDETINIVIGAS